MPLLAIPGNHDVPLFNLVARAFDPYRGFRRVFGDELEPRFESPQWLVQGVDCTRRWRHKNGELSQPQIDRVAAALRQASAAQLRDGSYTEKFGGIIAAAAGAGELCDRPDRHR